MFEEEDFQPMGYGYRLGSNPQTGNTYDASLEVTEQKCVALLREQEEDLNKKARSAEDEVGFLFILHIYSGIPFIFLAFKFDLMRIAR